MKIRFKRIHPNVNLPYRATPGSSGLDVFALEETMVYPDRITAVRTGLQVEIPPGYELQVRPRSGLVAMHGVTVANAPGTIDSDFRGEIKILLVKLTSGYCRIERNARIAQLVPARVIELQTEEADTLSDTERGEGGFGSTGR